MKNYFKLFNKKNQPSSSQDTYYSAISSVRPQRNIFQNLTGRFNTNGRTFSTGKLVIFGVIALTVIGLFYWVQSISKALQGSGSGNRVEISAARATLALNKEFAFPLRDQKGVEVSSLKYVIENAELRDNIIVKGQRASAVKGRIFLVLNLKINNDYNKTVSINTRDYIRLQVNGNDKELLAPEVHNDPVEVQATSTKFTRVSFPINETDKDLKLRVGEIDKEKTVLDIKF